MSEQKENMCLKKRKKGRGFFFYACDGLAFNLPWAHHISRAVHTIWCAELQLQLIWSKHLSCITRWSFPLLPACESQSPNWFISSPAGIQGGHFLAQTFELSISGGGWSYAHWSYTAWTQVHGHATCRVGHLWGLPLLNCLGLKTVSNNLTTQRHTGPVWSVCWANWKTRFPPLLRKSTSVQTILCSIYD